MRTSLFHPTEYLQYHNQKNGTIAYSDKLKGYNFVNFLKGRLILAKELLSDKGSIYLHTDYKIGHYVKVMMDEVFGIENFKNNITRIKCNPKNFQRVAYGNIKDMILFYSKTDTPIWNEPTESYTKDDIENLFKKIDDNNRRYTTVPIHAPGETNNPQPFKGILPPKGRHWRTDVATLEKWDAMGLIEWSSNGNPRKKIFADERVGKRVQDVWTYKDPAYPIYPTEKNYDLLCRIITTSSNQDSVVLDFLSGSGTTLVAANNLGRKWIGIDSSEIAIKTIKSRFNQDSLFKVDYNFITLNE